MSCKSRYVWLKPKVKFIRFILILAIVATLLASTIEWTKLVFDEHYIMLGSGTAQKVAAFSDKSTLETDDIYPCCFNESIWSDISFTFEGFTANKTQYLDTFLISESFNDSALLQDIISDIAVDVQSNEYNSDFIRQKYAIQPTIVTQVDEKTIQGSIFNMCKLQYVVIAWNRTENVTLDTIQDVNGTNITTSTIINKLSPILYSNGGIFYGGSICNRCNAGIFAASSWSNATLTTKSDVCISHSFPLVSPWLSTIGHDPKDTIYQRNREFPESIDFAYLYHASYNGNKPPYQESYDQLGNIVELVNKAVGPLFIFFVSIGLYMILKIGALLLKADDKDYKVKSFLASQGANLILFHPVVNFSSTPLIFYVVYEGIVDYARIILLVYCCFAALLIVVVILSGNKKDKDGKTATYNLLAVSVVFLTLLVITGLVVSIMELVRNWVNTALAVYAFFTRLTNMPFLFPSIQFIQLQFPLIAAAFYFQAVFALSLLGTEYLNLLTDFVESMCCGADIGNNGQVADDTYAKEQGVVVVRGKLMEKEDEYAAKQEEQDDEEKKKKKRGDSKNQEGA